MNRRVRGVCLCLILALAFGLSIQGVEHDLPFAYDSDEPFFVSTAIGMLHARSPNPRWFGHPATTTLYMLAGLYGAIYAAGLVTGRFSGPDDYRRLYQVDPTLFYLGGRVLSVGFGVASVFLVYAIGRRLFGNVSGFVAALFLAVSPLHVELSPNVRMDVLLPFFLLLAVWFTIQIVAGAGWRSHFLAGLSTGLAVITKWPAVVFVPVLLGAHFLGAGRRWKDLGGILVGLVVGSVVLAPWLVLDAGSVIADVTHQAREAHLSHTGTTFVGNAAWYVRAPLAKALSVLGLLLAAVGLLLCLRSRSRAHWVVAVFPLCFLAFVSSLHLRWERWILPVVPFGCILAALAVEEIRRRLAENGHAGLSRLALLGATAAIAVPLGSVSWRQGAALQRPHSITIARQWMLTHVPTGARVLVERYCPVLPFGQFQLFYVGEDGELVEAKPAGARRDFNPRGAVGKLRSVEDLEAQSIQFVVLSGLYDRYVAEESAYPREAERYREVTRTGKLIYDGGTVKRRRGPRIRVFHAEPMSRSGDTDG